MTLLAELLYRVCFGLAATMALVPPRQVTSGYFRNHSYVLLGGFVLAGLIAWSGTGERAWWPAAAGAVLSYVASVIWLYERPTAGRAALVLTAACGLWGSWEPLVAQVPSATAPHLARALALASSVTSGFVVGSALAAMFLGHWYLNAPTMRIDPLRRLVAVMAAAVALQAVVVGTGLGLETLSAAGGGLDATASIFLGLRWLAGIVGTWALCGMTWHTLGIPNTQAATGMLYVAVIATLTGEMAGLLLSSRTVFPV
jgi:hypothetical protein